MLPMNDQTTAAVVITDDIETLTETAAHKALRSERKHADNYRKEATGLRAQLAELLPRVEALEARPGAAGGADMAQLLAGIAEIRGGLLEQVERLRLEVRSELDELAARVDEVIRA